MKMIMKAIRIHQYGGPEVLAQVETQRPTPGPNELLIKVHAAAVNPVDWKLRAGLVKDMFPLTFPSTGRNFGFNCSAAFAGTGHEIRRSRFVLWRPCQLVRPR